MALSNTALLIGTSTCALGAMYLTRMRAREATWRAVSADHTKRVTNIYIANSHMRTLCAASTHLHEGAANEAHQYEQHAADERANTVWWHHECERQAEWCEESFFYRCAGPPPYPDYGWLAARVHRCYITKDTKDTSD